MNHLECWPNIRTQLSSFGAAEWPNGGRASSLGSSQCVYTQQTVGLNALSSTFRLADINYEPSNHKIISNLFIFFAAHMQFRHSRQPIAFICLSTTAHRWSPVRTIFDRKVMRGDTLYIGSSMTEPRWRWLNFGNGRRLAAVTHFDHGAHK